MPTYDYVCGACGHRLEIVHGIHSHGPAVCPVCGGPMSKAFVVPTVHFKGSGWAKKDRGAAAATKAAAKAGSGGDTGAGAGSDAAAGAGAGASGDGSATSDAAKKDSTSTKDATRKPAASGGED